jgi:hypothetical protein
MSQRKSFLLRIDPAVLDAVQRWANDDLRSLNGQIEFLLRRALAEARRAHRPENVATESAPAPEPGATSET